MKCKGMCNENFIYRTVNSPEMKETGIRKKKQISYKQWGLLVCVLRFISIFYFVCI